MTNPKDNHWNFLAESLGAEIKPDTPPPPRHEPTSSTPQRPQRSTPSHSEVRKTDWSELANSLGLPPTEPVPTKPNNANVFTEPPTQENAFEMVHHGEELIEEMEVIDFFTDDESVESETSIADESERETDDDHSEPSPERKRRRRRRGRRGRSKGRSERPVENEESHEQPAAESASEEAVTGEEEREEKPRERRGRRRRRRGSREPLKAEPKATELTSDDGAEEDSLQTADEQDAGGGESDFENERGGGPRGIPSWEHAVGHIISINMEQRSKAPKANGTRGRRGRGRRSRRRDKSSERSED